jgi:Biotin carboxylase, N-terminal domain
MAEINSGVIDAPLSPTTVADNDSDHLATDSSSSNMMSNNNSNNNNSKKTALSKNFHRRFHSVEEYINELGGSKKRVISKILIANNGVAAVKAIRSIRRWAYEVFGNERTIQFVVMATPEDLRYVISKKPFAFVICHTIWKTSALENECN